MGNELNTFIRTSEYWVVRVPEEVSSINCEVLKIPSFFGQPFIINVVLVSEVFR